MAGGFHDMPPLVDSGYPGQATLGWPASPPGQGYIPGPSPISNGGYAQPLHPSPWVGANTGMQLDGVDGQEQNDYYSATPGIPNLQSNALMGYNPGVQVDQGQGNGAWQQNGNGGGSPWVGGGYSPASSNGADPNAAWLQANPWAGPWAQAMGPYQPSPWTTPHQQSQPPPGTPYLLSPLPVTVQPQSALVAGYNPAPPTTPQVLAPIWPTFNSPPVQVQSAPCTPSHGVAWQPGMIRPSSAIEGPNPESPWEIMSILPPYSPRPSSSDSDSSSSGTGRPPENWRIDFKIKRSKSGLAAFFGRRKEATSTEFRQGNSGSLHHAIRYNIEHPPVSWDLRRDLNSISFAHLDRRRIHLQDLAQYTTEPCVYEMRIYHQMLPWYIDVRAAQGPGCLIGDLFTAIRANLTKPIRRADYYNQELDERDRDEIAKAFGKRCSYEGEHARRQGIKRVDFLRERVVFEGLVRGKNGMWEMKTSRMDKGPRIED
ncbi:hypothetical protein JAAARDRAFT_60653 [Jaapia argillacea MUCL 33604]|uniref:DUF6699 domain-containing protein n=1 Tax=Jaapia argillacea MUCL 33604 TaxID=933084 RepID=A0A067PV54_9AGAM|nr:hypothetical protein JAAARDRAFT_60653 [Jaapia argillacea MUCL 33604]